MASNGAIRNGANNGVEANGIARNGAANGVEKNGVSTIKRGQQQNGSTDHSSPKKVANGCYNGASSEESIPGKDDLAFLREVVDIVIKDGLIGAMDRRQ